MSEVACLFRSAGSCVPSCSSASMDFLTGSFVLRGVGGRQSMAIAMHAICNVCVDPLLQSPFIWLFRGSVCRLEGLQWAVGHPHTMSASPALCNLCYHAIVECVPEAALHVLPLRWQLLQQPDVFGPGPAYGTELKHAPLKLSLMYCAPVCATASPCTLLVPNVRPDVRRVV